MRAGHIRGSGRRSRARLRHRRRATHPDRPGRWATPLHLEGSEEEIFFVLSGTGVSVQWAATRKRRCRRRRATVLSTSRSARTHDHGRGRRPRRARLRAAPLRPNTLLPRAGVSWLGPTWVLEGAPTTTRGRGRPRSGRPRGPSWASARRASSTSRTSEPSTRGGSTVGRSVRDLGQRRRARTHRPLALPRPRPASCTTRRTATTRRRSSSSSSSGTGTLAARPAQPRMLPIEEPSGASGQRRRPPGRDPASLTRSVPGTDARVPRVRDTRPARHHVLPASRKVCFGAWV